MVLNRKDLIYSIYLCLNKLGPAWKGQELGIAETKLIQVNSILFRLRVIIKIQ